MNLYNFPHYFVYHNNVENHLKIKQSILPEIIQDFYDNKNQYTIDNWNCEVFSTMKYDLPILSNNSVLEEMIWIHVDNALSNASLTSYPKTSKITSIWYNVYEPGMFQEPHTHVGSSFSGIYLLELDGKNNTTFFNPSNQKYFYTTYTPEDVYEGDILIFPSDLIHYVNPVKSKKISIAFNILINF